MSLNCGPVIRFLCKATLPTFLGHFSMIKLKIEPWKYLNKTEMKNVLVTLLRDKVSRIQYQVAPYGLFRNATCGADWRRGFIQPGWEREMPSSFLSPHTFFPPLHSPSAKREGVGVAWCRGRGAASGREQAQVHRGSQSFRRGGSCHRTLELTFWTHQPVGACYVSVSAFL